MALGSQLLWRLYAGYVAVIVITTVIVGVLVGQQLSKNGMAEIEQSLASRSEMLAEIARPILLSGADKGTLQPTIISLGNSTDTRLTVIDVDGVVIADSQESPSNMDNHGQRPEVSEARIRGMATASRFSQTLQEQMIYRARRVDHDSNEIGFVRVSLPLLTIDQKLAELRWIILFSASFAALAALLFGFYFARRFTEPLSRMTEVAGAISKGDYDKRIAVGQNDEIGRLAEAFNRMAESSAIRMMEITSERNRLKKIFIGMVEGVIVVDQDQNIVHINNAAAALLGVSTSINKPIWEEIRAPEIINALQKTIESHAVVKTQMRQATSNEDLVVDIHAALLEDEEGELSGAVIVLHDISELDLLERVRRDFVANASHELKTPITAIRGMTETILDDPDMPSETQHSFIEKISTQSIRLSLLVTDLMTLSRLESAQSEDQFQPLNIQEIAQRCIDTYRSSCEEKNIELTFSCENKATSIDGNYQGISQLVDNLLDNAIKYTPINGSIVVEISSVDKQLNLRVKDTGIGISQSYQQRVFERFYRVDKARSRELGGTGLGLAIVKNVAEQHGGSVTLESQPGVGSTFIVTFPCAT